MTLRETKVLWADTIIIHLRDVFGWEVDEAGLGPCSVRVSDRLISSAEFLVSYSIELIHSARFRRSVGLNHFFQLQWLTFCFFSQHFPFVNPHQTNNFVDRDVWVYIKCHYINL